MSRGGGRDWSAVRAPREWLPVGTETVEAAEVKVPFGNAGNGGADQTKGASRSVFETDTQISGKRWALAGKKPAERTLQRWEDADAPAQDAVGLEWDPRSTEVSSGRKNWDQFKINEKLFGYVSTFKSDLSQYTTVLDTAKVSSENRKKAERIASEIEKGAGNKPTFGDDGAELEGHGDEEDLFSAVNRTCRSSKLDDGGWHENAGWGDDGWGSHEVWAEARHGTHSSGHGSAGDATHAGATGSGRGAAGAIMALLTPSNGTLASSTGSDCRSRVTPEVHAWWRERRLAGSDVPIGSEDALVCPFTGKVFGDRTQLVSHWAAVLPRGGADGDTDADAVAQARAATELFRDTAAALTWAEMAKEAGLDEAFPLAASKPGSVWEQVLTHVRKTNSTARNVSSGGDGIEPNSEADQIGLEFRSVGDFVAAATLMRPWRRDQKVEHREVLECIASALALHLLAKHPGSRLPAPFSWLS